MSTLDTQCKRVKARIECPICGYPQSECRYTLDEVGPEGDPGCDFEDVLLEADEGAWPELEADEPYGFEDMIEAGDEEYDPFSRAVYAVYE